jgi:hypothetical protein
LLLVRLQEQQLVQVLQQALELEQRPLVQQQL